MLYNIKKVNNGFGFKSPINDKVHTAQKALLCYKLCCFQAQEFVPNEESFRNVERPVTLHRMLGDQFCFFGHSFKLWAINDLALPSSLLDHLGMLLFQCSFGENSIRLFNPQLEGRADLG